MDFSRKVVSRMKYYFFTKPSKITESEDRSKGRSLLKEILRLVRIYFLPWLGLHYIALYIGIMITFDGGLLAYFKLFAMPNGFMRAFEVMFDLFKNPIAYLLFTLASAFTIPIIYASSRRKDNLSVRALGLDRNHMWREIICGYFSGVTIVTAFMLVLVALGASIKLNSDVSWLLIAIYFILFLLQGFSEEQAFRGYFMTALARRQSLAVSIIISSVAFACLHVFSGAVSVLTFLNLMLFGVFFSLVFIRRGSIWFVSAFHAAWNFISTCILSDSLTGGTLFTVETKSMNHLINGGSYGNEGSILITGIFVVGILILFIMLRKQGEF